MCTLRRQLERAGAEGEADDEGTITEEDEGEEWAEQSTWKGAGRRSIYVEVSVSQGERRSPAIARPN